MKKFRIQDKEAGNVIDEFGSLSKAEEALDLYERSDINDDIYEPDFYEIIEVDEEVDLGCTIWFRGRGHWRLEIYDRNSKISVKFITTDAQIIDDLNTWKDRHSYGNEGDLVHFETFSEVEEWMLNHLKQ